MGVHSILHGYIREAYSGSRGTGCEAHAKLLAGNDREIWRNNESVLASLPVEDPWPPLSRNMFAYPPIRDLPITYKGRPIHFAASVKEVEWGLRDWLDKFEVLLSQLYWEKAVVYVDTAYLGDHVFSWRPKGLWVHQLSSGVLRPITEWEFSSTMGADDLGGLRAE